MDPRDHRIVFYGAGSAAIGVARQIQTYFEAELGMTEEEARKVFWIVDSKVRIGENTYIYCFAHSFVIGPCHTRSR